MSSAPSADSSRSCLPAATCSSTAMASEIVLRSLRDAIPTRWPAKVDELRSLRRDQRDIGLAEFLDESGLDLDDIYDGKQLVRPPRRTPAPRCLAPGPNERTLRRAVGRLLHVDDAERLGAYRRLARHGRPPARGVAAPSASGGCSTCSSPPDRPGVITKTTSCRRPSTAVGPPAGARRSCRTVRRARSAGSTTCTRRCRRIRMRRCRSTPATHGSRSCGPRSRSTARKIARVAERRLRGQGAPTPNCSPSRSTRAAAASRRPPATGTTPSAGRSSTGRASPSLVPTARPGLRYQHHEREAAIDPAVRSAAGRRPRVLVPRPRHLPRPRR